MTTTRRKLRVVHVDPATNWRGGERQVHLLARELARRGHENLVVAAPGSALAERAAASGLSVHPVTIRGDLDFAALVRLAMTFRAFRPDIVHLHTSRAHGAGGLAARLAGVRPVLVTRRLELPIRGAFSAWKYRALADHYVAISNAVAAALLTGGVEERRITIIPSGVELPNDVPSRRAEGEGSGRRVVGTLAAFTDQKDPRVWIDVALDVCRRRPDVDFVWWGEGPFRRSLQEIANRENLGTRIELSGFHEHPEELWRMIDVFFLPSRFEALGTVLLDAMAAGVPVVASRVGGIPEIVRDGVEGVLVPPGERVAFGDAIVGFLENEDRSRSFGQAGRLRAREFAIEGVVTRTEDLYETLLATKSRTLSDGDTRA